MKQRNKRRWRAVVSEVETQFQVCVPNLARKALTVVGECPPLFRRAHFDVAGSSFRMAPSR